MSWIDGQFPAAVGHYRVTSQPDKFNNCIAYAAGVTNEWWEHTPGYKWPAFRSEKIASLVALFAGRGYQACASDALESGYEKVALYELAGEWTHAAKQLPTGKWTSKLGPDEDIEHDTPDCLCGTGGAYGSIHCIMRRPT